MIFYNNIPLQLESTVCYITPTPWIRLFLKTTATETTLNENLFKNRSSYANRGLHIALRLPLNGKLPPQLNQQAMTLELIAYTAKHYESHLGTRY